MKVFIDGNIVEGDQAKVSVFDHGLLYGDGVFEGIRAWDGRVFRLDDHLQRLTYGAKALHLPLPMGIDGLRDIVQRTVDAAAIPEAYIRLVVTRGVGALGIDIDSCAEPHVFCIVDSLKIFPKEKQLAGISLRTSSYRRPESDVLDPRVKSLNYINNILARVEAKRSGADEALLLNRQGHIAEASVANVFVVQEGALRTPPTSDGALDGMTRRTVIELAHELGIIVQEASLTRMDLFRATDAFVTGTGAGLVRVSHLDGELIGNKSPSSVVLQLLDAYVARTRAT